MSTLQPELPPDDIPLEQRLQQVLQQAIDQHAAGNLIEAESLYRSILFQQPSHPVANHNLGLLTVATGHAAAALPYFQAAIQANPNEAQFWLSCIDALIRASQIDAAREMLELGIRIGLHGDAVEALQQRMQSAASTVPTAPSPVGSTDASQAEPTPAEEPGGAGSTAAKRKAKHAKKHQKKPTPDSADACLSLGQMHQTRGALVEAEGCYRRAIGAHPRFLQAHFNLAEVLSQQGRLAEAEAGYRRAIEIQPDLVQAHNNLAMMLSQQGRLTEAEAGCRRAIELRPDLAVVHSNLAMLLDRQGRFVEAEASCRRALELEPNLAEAHNNLAMVLNKEGHFKDSEASCRQAIELKPELAEAHSNLANVLRKQDRPGEAEACCRRALELKPEFADAHSNLGAALMDQGQLAEAAASYRRALAIQPDLTAAHQDLLFCLSHGGEIAPQALFDEHLRFADRFEAPLRYAWPRHQNSREPDRQLRVGFVSSDFREHAMAHFMEPLFSQLAHDTGLSLYAYSNHAVEDGVTRRLRSHVSHWNQVCTLSDEMLAAKVQADGIDILVDLTGHTANSRLLAFARKPAPIQCGWIGYLGTSGLKCIDYYLADRYFLPPGDFDRYFTEKIVYLPAVATFQPSLDAPGVNPLPALTSGRFTFGSFSRISKLNPGVIALWSQLLRELPESQILIGAMPRDGRHQAISGWFHDQGIAPERLQFHPRSDFQTYFALHHQVDLCLDPFPFTGATTTSHALWMGVPTLTLTGQAATARLGPALLHHTGLDAFIAHSPRDFVEKGIYWANHLESLAQLRAGMRERFLRSPIGQPALVAQGLSDSFRQMWRDWCANSPDLSR